MHKTGVIADDLTGATDIATAYVSRGYRAVVLTGPAGVPEPDAEVVVAALKTRTAPVDDAVAASLDAYDRLRAQGCERFVFKYCSTFDSTDRGNIGPVLDALVRRTGARRVVVVPAFPGNARTVYSGHLFVGDRLLADSPMRDHPLTPMRRSRLVDLLAPQTEHTAGEIHLSTVRDGPQALARAIANASQRYLVVDAIADEDLAVIAEATEGEVLVSGAAGLALGARRGRADPAAAWRARPGRRLVVCGSASARTREQIAHAAAQGHPMLRLDVAGLAERPEQVVQTTVDWFERQDHDSVPVVYSAGEPGDVRSGAEMAARTETALARIVAEATDRGLTQCIVAGGETSGAVIGELGVAALRLGAPIAPGVCWADGTTGDGRRIALALKSGNFGGAAMFSTAWEVPA